MDIKTNCLNCEKNFFGRSDKKFCSTTCKNRYNYQLKKETKDITKTIDGILHRNRIILKIWLFDNFRINSKFCYLISFAFRLEI